jgi:hypothetical protein
MRKSLIAACALWALGAGQASAMQWVTVDVRDRVSMAYLSDSAYVDKLTGLIHVEVCTQPGQCHDPNVASNLNVTVATDAGIDCAKKTIRWMDFMEGINVDTVSAHPNARARVRTRANPFQRLRHGFVGPGVGIGRVFTKFCAQKATLPVRLAPDAPGAGLSIRLVDGGESELPPLPDDERLPLPSGQHFLWVRPDAIADRGMLKDVRVGAAPNAYGAYPLTLTLTKDGAKRLAPVRDRITGETFMIAIVADGHVLVAEEFRAPITNGIFQVDGGVTPKEAASLARAIAVWTQHTPE